MSTLAIAAQAVTAQVGQELMICYGGKGDAFKERRQRLRAWGFDCLCELCCASAEDIAKHDAVLGEMRRLVGKLESNLAPEERYATLHELVRAHEDNGVNDGEKLLQHCHSALQLGELLGAD